MRGDRERAVRPPLDGRCRQRAGSSARKEPECRVGGVRRRQTRGRAERDLCHAPERGSAGQQPIGEIDPRQTGTPGERVARSQRERPGEGAAERGQVHAIGAFASQKGSTRVRGCPT
jgi:hypothetical protein